MAPATLARDPPARAGQGRRAGRGTHRGHPGREAHVRPRARSATRCAWTPSRCTWSRRATTGVAIRAEVRAFDRTGVEMEALTAVSARGAVRDRHGQGRRPVGRSSRASASSRRRAGGPGPGDGPTRRERGMRRGGTAAVAVVGATGVVGREFLRHPRGARVPGGAPRARWPRRARSGDTSTFAGASVSRRGPRRRPTSRGSTSPSSPRAGTAACGTRRAPPQAGRARRRQLVGLPHGSRRAAGRAAGEPGRALEHRGIIANPNCSTILLVVVLAPLAARRCRSAASSCSTYQAVSGSGAAALAELDAQAEAARAGPAPGGAGLPAADPRERDPLRAGLRRGRHHARGVEDGEGDAAHPRAPRSPPHGHLRARARPAGAQRGRQRGVRAAGLARRGPGLARPRPRACAWSTTPPPWPSPRPATPRAGDDVLVGRIRRDPVVRLGRGPVPRRATRSARGRPSTPSRSRRWSSPRR